MSGLEQLRDIYDRSRVGLILVGMPGPEKRMARYSQLYSRVGFVHKFRPLGAEEVRFILEQKWQQPGLLFDPNNTGDAAAMAAATRVTAGNFRLVQRLFAQVGRLLQVNELLAVTKELVEAAREGLIIGGHLMPPYCAIAPNNREDHTTPLSLLRDSVMVNCSGKMSSCGVECHVL